ncbi:MAG TPA: succinyl-diaminopimelate desuccinylase [Acidimicrobiales bacterium]|nr:succinyl-diaminopimelate desuccinylase [Acidimicrobiales bacterium]
MRSSPVDLLALTAELVDVPSVSHHEGVLADRVEAMLREMPWLTVERVGTNVVARTNLGRPQRVVLAGHLDTVPANGNEQARIEGDTLWGLGSADMKAGCAVFLALAGAVREPVIDVTYVFYECEEVDRVHNGLSKIADARPDLLAADVAILGEPTGAAVEAGCQGVLRVNVALAGERAHTARPWQGRNAIHRLGAVLARVAGFEERRPVLEGCEFHEVLQAVGVEGGVAGNVVPDRAVVQLNHRFAPDRSADDALQSVRDVLGDTVDEAGGDVLTVTDASPPAPPGLDHPVLAALVRRTAAAPRAKLGWTDVALFAERGVPATNFGPGDPSVAHTAGEHVVRAEIESVYDTLFGILTEPA